MKSKKINKNKIFFHSLAMVLLLELAVIPLFGMPNSIRFQGRLTDQQGYPIVGPDLKVKFALFSVETGGTAVWEGSQIQTVATNDAGLFSTDIGPLTAPIFTQNDNLYLQVFVHDGGNFKALSPRQKLTVVPYAFHTENTSFATRSGWADDIPNNIVTGAKIQEGAITENKIAPHSIGTTTLNADIVNSLIPPGMIAMFDQSCPEGWSRFDQLDNRFPLGVPAFTGNPGGNSQISGLSSSNSGAHNHNVEDHTHSAGSLTADMSSFYNGGAGSDKVWVWGQSDYGLPIRGRTGSVTAAITALSAGAHQHSISSDGSWLPPYLGVVYCRKN